MFIIENESERLKTTLMHGAPVSFIVPETPEIPDPGDPDPEEPIPLIDVTASGPIFTDNVEEGGGTWTTPTEEGVIYTPKNGTANPGVTITVNAVADDGYNLIGNNSWTYTFLEIPEPGDIFVTASPPTFTDDTVSGGGTWNSPSIIGVIYTPASGTAYPGQVVVINATAEQGYVLGGTKSWTHTFPEEPAPPPIPNPNIFEASGPLKLQIYQNGLTFWYSPPVAIAYNVRLQVVVNPGTFNQRGGGTHLGVIIASPGTFPGGKHCGPVVRNGFQLHEQGIGCLSYFDYSTNGLIYTNLERWIRSSPWLALSGQTEVNGPPYLGKYNIVFNHSLITNVTSAVYRKGDVIGSGDILSNISAEKLGESEAGNIYAFDDPIRCGFFLIGDFVEPATTGCVEYTGIASEDVGKYSIFEQIKLESY